MTGGAEQPRLVFRLHAIQRMAERSIATADVRQVVELGESIEDYPDDFPFPSRLVLLLVDDRPLHVVLADNVQNREIIIITVYEPDLTQWETDYRTRRHL